MQRYLNWYANGSKRSKDPPLAMLPSAPRQKSHVQYQETPDRPSASLAESHCWTPLAFWGKQGLQAEQLLSSPLRPRQMFRAAVNAGWEGAGPSIWVTRNRWGTAAPVYHSWASRLVLQFPGGSFCGHRMAQGQGLFSRHSEKPCRPLV